MKLLTTATSVYIIILLLVVLSIALDAATALDAAADADPAFTATAVSCTADEDCRGMNGATCVGVVINNATEVVPEVLTCHAGTATVCYNGGKCLKPWSNVNRSPHWICDCESATGGFTGPDCNTPTEVTEEVGDNTVDILTEGHCQCVSGFTGDLCEIPVQACGPKSHHLQCQHGGKCTKPWANNNRSKQWACDCPAGRTGRECEELQPEETGE